MGIYLLIDALRHIKRRINHNQRSAGRPRSFPGNYLRLSGFGLYTRQPGGYRLLLKRALDPNLRAFNTVSKYFNLPFLGAVFVSGAFAWLSSGGFAPEISLFIKRAGDF